MIYRYGYLRREALALLCCGVAVCLVTATGCVDHRYDLKGDLDLSVGVGGKELTIPVGETEKITLEKLIGSDEDDLTVMPDGTYALLKRDDVQMDVAGIAPVTFRTHPFALSEIRPVSGRRVAAVRFGNARNRRIARRTDCEPGRCEDQRRYSG